MRHVFNDMESIGKFSSIKGQSSVDLSNSWYLFSIDSAHCWISTGDEDGGGCLRKHFVDKGSINDGDAGSGVD